MVLKGTINNISQPHVHAGSDITTGEIAAERLEEVASQSLTRQAIINGNFDIWQRGTTVTDPSTNTFLADRWKPTDYKVVTDYNGSSIVKRSDGASIPTDPLNKDYYEFLQVEKADEKSEITRTTLPTPKVEADPLLTRITELEDAVEKLNTVVSTLKTASKV